MPNVILFFFLSSLCLQHQCFYFVTSRKCLGVPVCGLTVVKRAGEWRDAGRGLKHSHTLTHTLTHTHQTRTHTQHTLGGKKRRPKRRTKVSGFLLIFCAFFLFSLNGRRRKKFPERSGDKSRSVWASRGKQALSGSFLRPGNYFSISSLILDFLTLRAVLLLWNLFLAGFRFAQIDTQALCW